MANVIAQLNKPTLIMSHNKTLAAQLYGEMKEFLSGKGTNSGTCEAIQQITI